MGNNVTAHLSSVVQPGVDGVAGGAQVRLSKLVLLGPAERGIAEAFLDDGVEPGQQEVETGTLVWSLWRSTSNSLQHGQQTLSAASN